jgi:hypothetical protein
VLVVLQAISFDRVFECALRELLSRGHHVHVAYGTVKRVLPDGAGLVLAALRDEYPGFSAEQFDVPSSRDADAARSLRFGLDYLRYLEPEYEHASALRTRAELRAPTLLRNRVGRRFVRSAATRHAVVRVMESLERAVRPPKALVEYLAHRRPDVVVVSPLVGLGSPQVEWMRAARVLGVPPLLLVASWDNLTNKGIVRGDPVLTVVWNERQIEEAVSLHGIERSRVVATGAHAFDHWFAWRPSTSRAEFAGRIGLDAKRRLILYVGSSSFISGDEASFAREWIDRLRSSERESLREAAVLIRPHPQNVAAWETFDEEPGRVVVWPRHGAVPTDVARKREYYDSLHHSSAVVGINTSALVESAIVGRPVLTVADPRFRGTQEGTLHFGHLVGEEDEGVLVLARDWEEHLDQLELALLDPTAYAKRLDRFVRTFVRPYGVDHEAAPRVADAVESAVGLGVVPAPQRLVTHAGFALVRTLISAIRRLRRAVRVPAGLPRPRAES